mmetsp:Transcript_5152/g.19315  ORF Transcript_5152/g.19315 Transcript_5152/m.19315 type:complete len:95 (+) Transcript_5152:539-823(+)
MGSTFVRFLWIIHHTCDEKERKGRSDLHHVDGEVPFRESIMSEVYFAWESVGIDELLERQSTCQTTIFCVQEFEHHCNTIFCHPPGGMRGMYFL